MNETASELTHGTVKKSAGLLLFEDSGDSGSDNTRDQKIENPSEDLIDSLQTLKLKQLLSKAKNKRQSADSKPKAQEPRRPDYPEQPAEKPKSNIRDVRSKFEVNNDNDKNNIGIQKRTPNVASKPPLRSKTYAAVDSSIDDELESRLAALILSGKSPNTRNSASGSSQTTRNYMNRGSMKNPGTSTSVVIPAENVHEKENQAAAVSPPKRVSIGRKQASGGSPSVYGIIPEDSTFLESNTWSSRKGFTIEQSNSNHERKPSIVAPDSGVSLSENRKSRSSLTKPPPPQKSNNRLSLTSSRESTSSIDEDMESKLRKLFASDAKEKTANSKEKPEVEIMPETEVFAAASQIYVDQVLIEKYEEVDLTNPKPKVITVNDSEKYENENIKETELSTQRFKISALGSNKESGSIKSEESGRIKLTIPKIKATAASSDEESENERARVSTRPKVNIQPIKIIPANSNKRPENGEVKGTELDIQNPKIIESSSNKELDSIKPGESAEMELSISKLKTTVASSGKESENDKNYNSFSDKSSYSNENKSLIPEQLMAGVRLSEEVEFMQTVDLEKDPQSDILYESTDFFTPTLEARSLNTEFPKSEPQKPNSKDNSPIDFDLDDWRAGYESPPELEAFPARRATAELKNIDWSKSGIAKATNATGEHTFSHSKQDSASTKASSTKTAVQSPIATKSPSIYGKSAIQQPNGRISIFNKFTGLFRATSPNISAQRSHSPIPPLPPSPSRAFSAPQPNTRSESKSSTRTSSNLLRKPSLSSVGSDLSSSADVDLLLARLDAANRTIELDPKAMKPRNDMIAGFTATASEYEEIDWDFWGPLLNDFEATVKRSPKLVSRRIQAGIPQQLRGMCWQIMANSKDPQLEMLFENLVNQESPHEKLIQADIPRTYPAHEYFKEKGGQGQKELGNVARAFSLYDTEMSQEEAFSVLVKLMQDYDLRGHYIRNMPALHRRLYQFDKLVEYHLPDVSVHFRNEEIKPDMYASQWFLTFFAYKCSLNLVCRVFDIVFAEGIESLLRLGIALLKANRHKILELGFEDLLVFLKNGLFDEYKGNEGNLLQDAMAVKITARLLRRFRQEFESDLYRRERDKTATEQLKIRSKQLEKELKRAEKTVSELNREHVDLANQLIQERVRNAELEQQRIQLRGTVDALRLELKLEQVRSMDLSAVDLVELTRRNVELKKHCDTLEKHVEDLEISVVTARMQVCEAEAERMNMEQQLRKYRK